MLSQKRHAFDSLFASFGTGGIALGYRKNICLYSYILQIVMSLIYIPYGSSLQEIIDVPKVSHGLG